MSGLNEERHHPATPARLKRAREEGDVAHSHELAIAIQMIAGVGALWFCAAAIGNGLQRTTIGLWSTSSISTTPDSIVQSSQSLIWATVRLVLPFLISVFVIGTMAHLVQTRFLVKRPEFSISNLSPMRWFGNIFFNVGIWATDYRSTEGFDCPWRRSHSGLVSSRSHLYAWWHADEPFCWSSPEDHSNDRYQRRGVVVALFGFGFWNPMAQIPATDSHE